MIGQSRPYACPLAITRVTLSESIHLNSGCVYAVILRPAPRRIHSQQPTAIESGRIGWL
jgi:hypothetical protein